MGRGLEVGVGNGREAGAMEDPGRLPGLYVLISQPQLDSFLSHVKMVAMFILLSSMVKILKKYKLIAHLPDASFLHVC